MCQIGNVLNIGLLIYPEEDENIKIGDTNIDEKETNMKTCRILPGTGWSPGIACALGLNGIIWVKSGRGIFEDSSSGSIIPADRGWKAFTAVLATSL